MLDLANPDAMFARTGAAGGEGAGNKTVIEGVDAREVGRVIRLHHHQHMKIAVTDMADNGRHKTGLGRVALAVGHNLSQARYRHTDIRGEDAPPGIGLFIHPRGIVTRLP